MKKIMFLILSVFCLTALSDATVIYKEDFRGPVNTLLNGRAPTIGPAGKVWSAGANIKADGTIYNAGVSLSGDTAFLPFVPQSGKLYELVVHINATTGDWIATGFTNTMNTGGGTTSQRFINATNCVFWALARSTQSTAPDQTFTGIGTAGWLNTTTNNAKKIRITLDTRNSLWEVKWYLNDILQRTVSNITPASYPINYVAFGNAKCNGTITRFRLSILDCASNPTPADLSSLPGATALTFNIPAGASKYDVWFSKADANELDYKSKLTKITTVTGADPAQLQNVAIPAGQIPLMAGKYTWVVDSYIGSPSYADPNGPGFAWQFTITDYPVITAHPADQFVLKGGTAVFTVVAASQSTCHYIWYRSTDNANNTTADDTAVGTDSATLSVSSLSIANEGYYYCKVVNNSGEANAVRSSTAKLGVQRQVAHYTLDSLVSGQYLDSGEEGHNAAVTGEPNIIDGVVPAKTNKAAVITNTRGYALAGTWNPSNITGAMTLSMWVKWDGVSAGVNQHLMCKASTLSSNDMLWRLVIAGGASQVQFQRPDTVAGIVSSVALTPGEWQYVAVTYDGINVTFYSVETGKTTITSNGGAITSGYKPDSNFWIGALGAAGGTAIEPFHGAMDEIQIFNYVKDAKGIVSLYNEVIPRGFCMDQTNEAKSADLNGDCVVNLADFAKLAGGWLNCGLYPELGCNL